VGLGITGVSSSGVPISRDVGSPSGEPSFLNALLTPNAILLADCRGLSGPT
jgi:hypothetical protein